MKQLWEAWENEIQQRLGLDSTVCSGNKFYDVGDAKDNANPNDSGFRLLVDCKYTEANSYSLTAKFLGQSVDKAQELGKRFLLAVRFRPKASTGPRDYVVLTLDDFEELLEKATLLDDVQAGRRGLPLTAADRAAVVDRTFLERDEYRMEVKWNES